ncbi:MAG: aminotransferase class V-fold PLP-dependent enzyme [Candidatus Latescibacteria bacterium]|nr:aminotransferase class V-fold PLP-dependent enzyme [Candidatus Latescibacterota bacterium]
MLTDAARAADFPSLTDRVYLNTAAEGVPPRQVIDALTQYGHDKTLGMDGRERHRPHWESAREQVAAAYGFSADEIGICSCTSEAFILAATAVRLQEGDEVIINDLDFPAGVTAWLQPDCPARVKVWRSEGGALRVDDLIPLLGPKTRLVTGSLVSFYNGFMIPVAEVVDAVRRHSPALLALDVTQALGRIPLELTGVDMAVSSTHKWILASHGGGLVGIPRSRSDVLTAATGGWFGKEDPFRDDRFDTPSHSKPGAESYMVGMPNYAAIYAINAGLEYIHGVGIEAIDAHARPLVMAVLEGLKKLPVELLTPDDPASIAGILAFCHPDSERIHRLLHDRGIHVMHQAGRVRISLHGYNTMEHVDALLGALADALR